MSIREIIQMRNDWQQTFGNPPDFIEMNQVTADKMFAELQKYTNQPIPKVYTEAHLMGMKIRINGIMSDGDVVLGD